MKPLKELPILRLPFRAMEEVSKRLHSIIKMIRTRRNNNFPILRLPFLVIEEIFKTMDPIEIINFSMISKRTKTVAKLMSFYSKYLVHLYVRNFTLDIGLLGTKKMVTCTYIMTSDKKMNGKSEEKEQNGCIEREVYKYSKNPLEDWKKLSIHVLEIFKKQSINYFAMQMDAFADHISIINSLKATVSERLLSIPIESSKQHTWLDIKNYFFNGRIPKNLKKLYINDSRWIGFEKLLEIDCKSVILRNYWISEKEWNLFFKKWIAMETHLNLEYLELSHKHLETFRALVLHDIPHEVVDRGVKRTLIAHRDEKAEISGGIDIRIDGKMATFFVYRELWKNSFAMSIH